MCLFFFCCSVLQSWVWCSVSDVGVIGGRALAVGQWKMERKWSRRTCSITLRARADRGQNQGMCQDTYLSRAPGFFLPGSRVEVYVSRTWQSMIRTYQKYVSKYYQYHCQQLTGLERTTRHHYYFPSDQATSFSSLDRIILLPVLQLL